MARSPTDWGLRAIMVSMTFDASAAGAMPSMSLEMEQERRRTLFRHKTGATMLLVIAAVIFLFCSWWESRPGDTHWIVGYIRAGAEAGMIGGLADWFAVTALFRHPMRIPIPHTALIPRKKDQLAGALADFVGENFLNPQLLTQKISQAQIPEKIGDWLAVEENAHKVSHEAGKLLANATRAFDRKEAASIIDQQLFGRLAIPEWGPYLGRTLESLIADGKTEPLVDATVTWARERAAGAEATIVNLIDERMPSWSPRFMRELVGERVYRELMEFLADVDDDPNHEARGSIRRFIDTLAHDLQHDPKMISRVEGLKSDILQSKAVQAAPGQIWDAISQSLIEAGEDEESILRTRITELCMEWGVRIREDEELRAQLDERISSAASFLANNYAGDITSIISETIQRWDGEEASEKIELMVGKDLQYIRVNGTVVGALAGIAIYAVNQALFG